MTDFFFLSVQEEDVLAASFRRRKIVSNWDRYQSLPPENEDENLSEIGADFGKLLSQTGENEWHSLRYLHFVQKYLV